MDPPEKKIGGRKKGGRGGEARRGGEHEGMGVSRRRRTVRETKERS